MELDNTNSTEKCSYAWGTECSAGTAVITFTIIALLLLIIFITIMALLYRQAKKIITKFCEVHSSEEAREEDSQVLKSKRYLGGWMKTRASLENAVEAANIEGNKTGGATNGERNVLPARTDTASEIGLHTAHTSPTLEWHVRGRPKPDQESQTVSPPSTVDTIQGSQTQKTEKSSSLNVRTEVKDKSAVSSDANSDKGLTREESRKGNSKLPATGESSTVPSTRRDEAKRDLEMRDLLK